jgi:aspartokinase
MQEAAETETKVLNARAVEWAAQSGVLICARKTADFAGASGGRETRVRARRASGETFAVVVDAKIAWLSAPAERAESVLAAVAAAELPVREVSVGATLELVLSLLSAPDFSARKPALAAAGTSQLREDVSAVSVVGVGVTSSGTRLAKALALLPAATLASHAGPLRLTALVPNGDAEALERAWHALFVENAGA